MTRVDRDAAQALHDYAVRLGAKCGCGEHDRVQFRAAIAKYNPNYDTEPRIPAGSHEGGWWTVGGDASAGLPLRDLQPAEFFFFFEEPPVMVRPPLPEFPTDLSKPPGPGWIWKGQPDEAPGGPRGNWFNPKTGESIHNDMNHPKPTPPHLDYRVKPNGQWYRWYPDGRMEPKPKVAPPSAPDSNSLSA